MVSVQTPPTSRRNTIGVAVSWSGVAAVTWLSTGGDVAVILLSLSADLFTVDPHKPKITNHTTRIDRYKQISGEMPVSQAPNLDPSLHENDAKITKAELAELIGDFGPFVAMYGFVPDEIGAGVARVRLPYSDDHVRPGGTISGPAMMALADYAMYVAVLGAIGPVALAVTTNLNINFLRKPSNVDLICEARIIKLGRRLAIADMSIFADGDEALCAHATATYSIPPDR